MIFSNNLIFILFRLDNFSEDGHYVDRNVNKMIKNPIKLFLFFVLHLENENFFIFIVYRQLSYFEP